LAYESADSARAQLIETRRGTWIDESLLPAARQECLEILRAAYEAVGEDVAKAFCGDEEHLEEVAPLRAPFHYRGPPELNPDLIRSALDTLGEELLKYRLPEEEKAQQLAHEVRETAGICGSCGRELSAHESAHVGAEVYVGMRPLSWRSKPFGKPRICEPYYMSTVLCRACAPEWLSPERDDVVTQLCAHCERPMVSRLKLSELGNMFCSDTCQRAYRDQLRREKKAEELTKVCEVCGEEFTATRRDAKTCSPKCKQKAHRQRQKEVRENR
jgi:hypothetical protein